MTKEGVEYFITHLKLINPLFDEEKQLTKMEIVVLAHFMNVDTEIAKVDRFHREVRKEVKTKLSLSNGGLSNYLRAFIEKEFVGVNVAETMYIKEYIYPEEIEQFYQFKLLKGKRDE